MDDLQKLEKLREQRRKYYQKRWKLEASFTFSDLVKCIKFSIADLTLDNPKSPEINFLNGFLQSLLDKRNKYLYYNRNRLSKLRSLCLLDKVIRLERIKSLLRNVSDLRYKRSQLFREVAEIKATSILLVFHNSSRTSIPHANKLKEDFSYINYLRKLPKVMPKNLDYVSFLLDKINVMNCKEAIKNVEEKIEYTLQQETTLRNEKLAREIDLDSFIGSLKTKKYKIIPQNP